MSEQVRRIIFAIYNMLLLVIYALIWLASRVYKPWREHLRLRRRVIRYYRENPISGVELFFCSSAGEYEQALPLIERLEKERPVLIIFFSPSGLEFASRQGESRPFFLAPLDLPQFWREFFSYVQPHRVFIIRHELWPNFIKHAASLAPVVLIDASIRSNGIAIEFLYQFLTRDLDSVFAVSLYDYNTLKYLCSSSRVHLSGDTKYDRVAGRKRKNSVHIERYKERLLAKFPGKNYLIIGSAWPKDTEIILQSLRLLPDETREKWRVFIAPHDLSHDMLELQSELVRKYGFSCRSYAQYKSEDMDGVDVVMVDRLGILFELYGGFDLAFVGGAMHHKIHNVLEPAIFGLHVGFGPRYHNQKEARFIVEKDLAQVIQSAEDGAAWLKSHSDGKPGVDNRMIKYIDSLLGATEQIVKTL